MRGKVLFSLTRERWRLRETNCSLQELTERELEKWWCQTFQTMAPSWSSYWALGKTYSPGRYWTLEQVTQKGRGNSISGDFQDSARWSDSWHDLDSAPVLLQLGGWTRLLTKIHSNQYFYDSMWRTENQHVVLNMLSPEEITRLFNFLKLEKKDCSLHYTVKCN